MVISKVKLGLLFQGRVSEIQLFVESSFKHAMQVKSLSVLGNDPRFSFQLADPPPSLTPGQRSHVGRVLFDPGAACRPTEDCYTGFLPQGKFGHPWYLGLALPLNLGDMDLAIVHALWSRMKAVALPQAVFNVTLRLDTTEVRGCLFGARAALSWPILSVGVEPIVRFPLTQLGNATRRDVLLVNPSSLPVLFHIVPLTAYPNAAAVLAMLPNRIKTNEPDELDAGPPFLVEDSSVFQIESVTDAEDPTAPLATFGEDFAERFGIGVAANTYPLILRPLQAVRVSVLFQPSGVGSGGLQASVLFLRNNLTGLEAVDLVGQGAVGDFKFGNRRAGSTIHAFEVTEKHLRDCGKTGSSSSLPNLTVKRPFTARNTGQVPLWVTGFHIDGEPCEGYGFKVLDCEPFLLAANDSKKINIAFTPDFTLARVTRTLTLRTSLSAVPGQGDVKYALAATVPAHLLARCASSLPRPRWEAYLYYIIISLMGLSLACILIAAFVEADRILRYCFIMTSMVSPLASVPDSANLLDLREVARATLAECEERQKAVAAAVASSSPGLSRRLTSSPTCNMSTSNPASGKSSTGGGGGGGSSDQKHMESTLHRRSNINQYTGTSDDNTRGLAGWLTTVLGLLYVPFKSFGRFFHQQQADAGHPLNNKLRPADDTGNKSVSTVAADPMKTRLATTDSAVKGFKRSERVGQQSPTASPAAVTRTLSSSSTSNNNGKSKSKSWTPAGKTSSTSSLSSTSDPTTTATTNNSNSTAKTKPKISTQSSVNDEMETSSTTTESSSPGDLSDGPSSSSSGHRSSSSSSGHNRRRGNNSSKPVLDLGLLTSTLIAASGSSVASQETGKTTAEQQQHRRQQPTANQAQESFGEVGFLWQAVANGWQTCVGKG